MIEVFAQFFRIGFAHIIPYGLDHVLFVFGLFLLCREFTALVWQITLFTIAHSMTMGLSMGGVLQLPSSPVEVLIALSIALIAAENFFHRDLTRWRNIVVILSGLVHGLGFAHAFSDYSIPKDNPLMALLGMSLGVEVGQVLVVTVAFFILGAFWKRPWYRRWVVIPASTTLILVGLWWSVPRLPA